MKRFLRGLGSDEDWMDLRIVEEPIPDYAREHRDVRLLMMTGDRAGSHEVGRLDLVDGRTRDEGPFMRVKFVQTRGTFQRRKVATRLYEAAAKLACERYGLPLASDVTRYAGSEGFWSKQRRLGRASCYKPNALRETEDWCMRYILPCPPPKSLEGSRRRPLGFVHRPQPISAIPFLLGLLGVTILGTWLLRRKAEAPLPDSIPPDRSKALGPPLPPPLRSMTPKGGYMAPRWKLPSGATTGDRTKVPWGTKPHHYHEGVDLRASPGESVLAVGDGTVTNVFPPGGGACLIGLRLDLGGGRYAIYCDMGKVTVAPGAKVKRGDKVGEVHARGFVHVAVKDRSGKALDPAGIIPYRGSFVA